MGRPQRRQVLEDLREGVGRGDGGGGDAARATATTAAARAAAARDEQPLGTVRLLPDADFPSEPCLFLRHDLTAPLSAVPDRASRDALAGFGLIGVSRARLSSGRDAVGGWGFSAAGRRW